MNSPDHGHPAHDRPGHAHDGVDRAVRALHAAAVAHVSAATMAQLHRRRHAALATPGTRASRVRGWPLAAGLASLAVVALGLGFGLRSTGDAIPAQPVLATAAGDGDTLEDAITGLDENPDFYLWLASRDADLLAME